MMKLLSSKTNSICLLLCVFLSQLWGVTDSTTTSSSTAIVVTQTTITTPTTTTETPVARKASPSNVQNVTVVERNESSITLMWEKVDSISTYILLDHVSNKGENINQSNADTSVLHVVSGLTAGTLYSFTLITVLNEDNSTGHNFKAATAPSNVQNVIVEKQDENSITLKWEKVDSISTYILLDHVSNKGENINQSNADTSVSHVVSGLTAGTLYSFTLITVLNKVNSSGHDFEAATAPGNVQNVIVEKQDESSITLKWEKVDNISTYILLDHVSNKGENITQSNADTSVSHVVSGLTAGTLYSFTLITVLNEVNSTGHNFKAATAPTNAENVVHTAQTETNITLTWTKVNGSLNYILRYNGTDKSITLEVAQQVFEVSGLIPGTLYNFTLITVVNEVNSSGHDFKAVTTIDCARVDWHVTNSTIHGIVEGLFSNATATYKSQTHVSPGGSKVSFDGLYPGATYEIHLEYEMNNNFYTQCRHNLTLRAPDLSAHCENWAGGYSISVVLNVMDGVWTSVEVNVTGKSQKILKDDIKQSIVLDGFQPAKRYPVSVTTLSGSLRSNTFEFACPSDPRGVIAGSVCAVVLFCILVCLAIFIFLKRPDIISRKKSFISGSRQSKKEAKAISAAKFSDHFNQLSLDDNRGFSQEYEDLSTVGTDQTRRAALLPENKVKNRFTNVLPYDWCRVKLTPSDPSGTSDYINANYMPGYNSNREYIATQGPLPSTVNDFWRMVWEQRVTGIVMVTNCTEGGRTKCEQYWPTDSHPCLYGELVLTVTSEQQEANWTLREFRVKHKNISQERTVKHFHFTAWPDHGVPQCTEVLIQFRGLVRQHIEREGSGSPTVVHCSAGVGRTGTIIALDVLLQQLQNQRAVGINAFVHKMRLNRPYMVQTESQYVFLHQCIMDSLHPKEIPEENLYENVDMIYVNATALREFHKNNLDN